MESVNEEVRSARKRLEAITAELQVDEVRARRSFALAEKEGEGGVELSEITGVVSGLGVAISDLDLRLVLDGFLNRLGRDSGTINLDEYMDLYRAVLRSERMRRKWELRLNILLESANLLRIARDAFRVHEEKYQGYVSEDDLAEVLRSLQVTLSPAELASFAEASTIDGKVEEAPFASACVQLWEAQGSEHTLQPVAKAIRRSHQEEKAETEAVFALAGRDSIQAKDLLAPLLACGWDEQRLTQAGLGNAADMTLEQLVDALVTFSVCKPHKSVR